MASDDDVDDENEEEEAAENDEDGEEEQEEESGEDEAHFRDENNNNCGDGGGGGGGIWSPSISGRPLSSPLLDQQEGKASKQGCEEEYQRRKKTREGHGGFRRNQSTEPQQLNSDSHGQHMDREDGGLLSSILEGYDDSILGDMDPSVDDLLMLSSSSSTESQEAYREMISVSVSVSGSVCYVVVWLSWLPIF